MRSNSLATQVVEIEHKGRKYHIHGEHLVVAEDVRWYPKKKVEVVGRGDEKVFEEWMKDIVLMPTFLMCKIEPRKGERLVAFKCGDRWCFYDMDLLPQVRMINKSLSAYCVVNCPSHPLILEDKEGMVLLLAECEDQDGGYLEAAKEALENGYGI